MASDSTEETSTGSTGESAGGTGGATSTPTAYPTLMGKRNDRPVPAVRPLEAPEVPEVLTGQVQVPEQPVQPVETDARPGERPDWPECIEHKEVQHRDRRPPWCNACGWNRGNSTAAARYGVPRR